MSEQVEPSAQNSDAPPAGSADAAPAAQWARIAELRQVIRRFAHTYASLPVKTRATCPSCQSVVDAVFDRTGDQIVLTFECPRCDCTKQVHHDAIWTHLASDRPGSATHTWNGTRVHPVLRRLPRTVESLCPQCGAIVLGRYFVANGAVFVEKTCPEHGYFRDCVNSDVLLQAKNMFRL